MRLLKLTVAIALCVSATPALTKVWQIKMVNRGPGGLQAFSPSYLAVAPGDSVSFVPVDMGHNAEMIPGMGPAGAAGFKGKMNEALTVKLTSPGLYVYKCFPHLSMGMIGLIKVGSADNRKSIVAQSLRLPPLAQRSLAAELAQVH